MTTQTRGDNAGVLAPPPLISLAALFIGLGLDWVAPIGLIETALHWTARVSLAVAIGALATWLVARGIMEFRRMGTPVDPRKPVATLVTTGIFARTRNPLYQCQGLLLLALAVVFASDWAVLLIVPWAVAMHFGVVVREERYLEAKFGDDYRRYKERVPRYGWPF
jgi:protein-S-isoprenylcysteine O-methyltransferase Ste14